MPVEVTHLPEESIRICDNWINKNFKYSVKISEPESIGPYIAYRTSNKKQMNALIKKYKNNEKCRIVMYNNREIIDNEENENYEFFIEGIGTTMITF